MRGWIEWAAEALILVLVSNWLIPGLFSPLVVCSGSMAPTLLGPHWDLTCQQCGVPFVCEAVEPMRPGICPNCGYEGNAIGEARTLPGDRVLVARPASMFRSLRRWEPVVLRHPEQAAKVLVKRIVGLPGETLEIHHGDVYVNGQIQRKDLARQWALALLVHDADRPPATGPRWQTTRSDTGWNAAHGQFSWGPRQNPAESRRFSAARHEPGDSEPGDRFGFDSESELDWLVYCHGRRVPGDSSQVASEAVKDDFVYNRAIPRLEPSHVVDDLLLALRLVRCEGAGRIHLRAGSGDAALFVSLDLRQRRCQLWRRTRNQPVATADFSQWRLPSQLVFSSFDRQVTVALDERVLLCEPLEGPLDCRPFAADPARPLAIAVEQAEVGLDRLCLYRDVYYTAGDLAARESDREPTFLGPAEYYVVGDNPVVSDDSRSWARGVQVEQSQIIGPLWAAASYDQSWWGRLALPNLARIRRIR